MKRAYIIFIFFLAVQSCSEKRPVIVDIPRDKTINQSNSVSELFLDSLSVENYIKHVQGDDSSKALLRNFYNSRNYQYAWINSDGLAEQALAFWNLHNSYIKFSKDSSMVDKELHKKMERLVNGDTIINSGSSELIPLELQLTEHFFRYAQYAYAGKVDPSELQWHIPRKKLNVVWLLDSLLKRRGRDVESWEPLSTQYRLMKDKLALYDNIQENEIWPEIPEPKSKYKEGDTSVLITHVKMRLRSSLDYKEKEFSNLFTPELVKAVKTAQRRFGFRQDGLISGALVKELNVPVGERIKQLLINMERMKWMAKEPLGNRLVVNIPEFKLHVYENGKEAFNMNVVVGKAASKTVVFNGELKNIVFSPYWNIPQSIVRNEILPGIRRSSGYLRKRNMEQVGFSNGIPLIRQKPGGSNALGRVKFLFPNSYAIYFHDTPSKSLFKRENRAFSHGCIRLEKPEKLAKYLLRNKPGWTNEKIKQAMFAGKEKWVTLDEPVPVFISYFTAWVDDEGLLNFRHDIYDRDKKLIARLFE